MSHLLRRPGAIPALFSPGIESGPPPVQARARTWTWRNGAPSLMLPALALFAELPLMHGAAQLLRLALPH